MDLFRTEIPYIKNAPLFGGMMNREFTIPAGRSSPVRCISSCRRSAVLQDRSHSYLYRGLGLDNILL